MPRKSKRSKKSKKQPEQVVDHNLPEDDGDEDWEDARDLDLKDIIGDAKLANKLVIALMNHPDCNQTNPWTSLKPLAHCLNFAMRTLQEYAFPLLPRNSHLKHPYFANPKLIDYDGEPVPKMPPTAEQDEWLEDPHNWPVEDDEFKEMRWDLHSRNMWSAFTISDREKGGMIIGGQVDFGDEVEGVVTEIFGGTEEREKFMNKSAGFKDRKRKRGEEDEGEAEAEAT